MPKLCFNFDYLVKKYEMNDFTQNAEIFTRSGAITNLGENRETFGEND